jgi:hypothetical protein
MVRTGGGGPRIGSPEEALVFALVLVVAVVLWFWKVAD